MGWSHTGTATIEVVTQAEKVSWVTGILCLLYNQDLSKECAFKFAPKFALFVFVFVVCTLSPSSKFCCCYTSG